MRIMTVVGALHNIRCISMDRPVGQPSSKADKPKEKKTKDAKGKKEGNNTPENGSSQKAPWKRTPEYKSLEQQRERLVLEIKALGLNSPDKESKVAELRHTEQGMRDLRNSMS
jgi:hypothetical protein